MSVATIAGVYDSSAGDKVRSYINQADLAASSGVSSADINYSKVSGLVNNVKSITSQALSSASQLTNIGSEASSAFDSTNYDAARAIVNEASSDISQVRQAAANINSQADSLKRYENVFSNYGDTIWDQASQVVSSGLGTIGIGNALLNLDASGGGVAGEWANLYNALSGDNQVSMAASDIQSSYQNAGEQALRAKARTGAQGGTTDVLRKQYAQSLATALAAAKTRARKAAISDQSSMLEKITGAAKDLIGTGTTTYSAGLSGQTEAGKMKESAAGIVKDVADIYKSGGSLYGSAAELQINQGTALGTIQAQSDSAHNAYLSTASDAYGKSGTLAISAADAVGSVISALNSAASLQVTASKNNADVLTTGANIINEAIKSGNASQYYSGLRTMVTRR